MVCNYVAFTKIFHLFVCLISASRFIDSLIKVMIDVLFLFEIVASIIILRKLVLMMRIAYDIPHEVRSAYIIVLQIRHSNVSKKEFE